MKQKGIIFIIALAVITLNLSADYLHTVDRKKYEGKMVAFRFNTIYFNVYKFGEIQSTKRFPIYRVWKIELNDPREEGMESSFEVEEIYNRLRKGKQVKKVSLPGNRKWLDTGIDIKVGQEILFLASGSIHTDKTTVVYHSGEELVKWNKNKPMPNQPTGAVIGRVGRKGELFYIGDDKAPFQMWEKGRLYVGINDFDFSNNSGQFNVTIYY